MLPRSPPCRVVRTLRRSRRGDVAESRMVASIDLLHMRSRTKELIRSTLFFLLLITREVSIPYPTSNSKLLFPSLIDSLFPTQGTRSRASHEDLIRFKMFLLRERVVFSFLGRCGSGRISRPAGVRGSQSTMATLVIAARKCDVSQTTRRNSRRLDLDAADDIAVHEEIAVSSRSRRYGHRYR